MLASWRRRRLAEPLAATPKAGTDCAAKENVRVLKHLLQRRARPAQSATERRPQSDGDDGTGTNRDHGGMPYEAFRFVLRSRGDTDVGGLQPHAAAYLGPAAPAMRLMGDGSVGMAP